jgi:hypothetical protein
MSIISSSTFSETYVTDAEAAIVSTDDDELEEDELDDD